MKFRAAIGFLLLICGEEILVERIMYRLFSVEYGVAASSVAKRGLSEIDRKSLVKNVNEFRAFIAEQTNPQLADMNALTYSFDLEKKAEKITCQTMVNGPDYMVSAIPNEKAMKLFTQADDKDQAEFLKKTFLGLLVPAQTQIGCAYLNPPCQGRRSATLGVCAVGPISNFISGEAVEKGPPGSRCKHGKRADKLCLVPGASGAKSLRLNIDVFIIVLVFFFL
ncbi:hypothetical protein CRE_21738 [Caenorhabditis remanei]|uniref:Uncharacterized protein n=1 Tax=Caenorhabditis remanei TaxID=31234 RepID=E3MEJ3_CAERE|nr:hypothetical protein CRE_21738 [Caenorhabditis remanei]